MNRLFFFCICFSLFFSVCLGNTLLISEVYVDGTDEWIEIVNIGEEEFVGEISLHGIKSTEISVPIMLGVGSVLVIGDALDMVTAQVISQKNMGLSLVDTAAIAIQLYIQGVLVDSFEVDQEKVKEGDNTKTSREKICIGITCTISPTSFSIGVLVGYTASPGVYITNKEEDTEQGGSIGSGNVGTTGEFLSGTTIEIEGAGTGDSIGSGGDENNLDEIFSGSVISGQTQPIGSGDQENELVVEVTPLEQTINPGDILITEVHANDTTVLGEYIIIESSIFYTGPLLFLGLGQGDAQKVANVSLSPGEHLIFTDSPDNISPDEYVYTFPSLTLSNAGETLSLFLDETLLDIIHYKGSKEGEVNIYTTTTAGVRQFDTTTASSVKIKSTISPSCNIHIDALGINEKQQVLYNLSFVEVDQVYCSSWYSTQRAVNETLFNGCSFNIELSSGQHFVSNSISNQETTLCSSFTSIYNYIPSLGSGISDQKDYSGAILRIEEIYPRDTETFSEYIEFLALQSYTGPITLGGLGQGDTEKIVDISVHQGERFLVSDGTGKFSPDTKVYYLSSISLTNSGEEIFLYGQDGQGMDIVVYGEGDDGKSLYYTAYSGSILTFFTSGIPTPGFTYDQVKFLLEKKEEDLVTSCSIHLQHTKPLFVGNKINLIAQVDEKDIQNSSTTYACDWGFPGSSYIFDEGCNPSYYDYGEEGIHTVTVRITNQDTNEVCQTALDINYPQRASDLGSSSDTGDTYYQGLYKKRKARFEMLKKETSSLGYSVSTSGYILGSTSSAGELWGQVLTGVIHIEKLLPNPAGADTDHEQITLKNLSHEDISLEGYKLFNGTSRKKIPDIVLPANEETTIVGSLGLTNRATCVYLQREDITYDIFCYPKAGDDVWFDTSLSSLENQEGGSPLDALKDIKLQLKDDTACVLFKKDSFLCTALSYHEDDVKQRKKDAKKYVTATRTIQKETQRANNWRGKYSDQVARRKRDAASFQGRIAKEKSTTNWYRTQSNIHEAFTRVILEELQTNWAPVFYGSSLVGYTTIYRQILTQAKSSVDAYVYHGLSLPLERVGDILDLTQENQLPLVQSDLPKVYRAVIEETQGTLASFSQNLKQ